MADEVQLIVVADIQNTSTIDLSRKIMAVAFKYFLRDGLILVDPGMWLCQTEWHLDELKVAGAVGIVWHASCRSGHLDDFVKLEHIVIFFLPVFDLPLEVGIELHYFVKVDAVAPDGTLLDQFFEESESFPKCTEDSIRLPIQLEPHLQRLTQVHAINCLNTQFLATPLDRML